MRDSCEDEDSGSPKLLASICTQMKTVGDCKASFCEWTSTGCKFHTGAELEAETLCEEIEGAAICTAHPHCYYNPQFHTCEECAQGLPDQIKPETNVCEYSICETLAFSRCSSELHCVWIRNSCEAEDTGSDEFLETLCTGMKTAGDCQATFCEWTYNGCKMQIGAELEADSICEELQGSTICTAHPHCYYDLESHTCDLCEQRLSVANRVVVDPNSCEFSRCDILDFGRCTSELHCIWNEDSCEHDSESTDFMEAICTQMKTLEDCAATFCEWDSECKMKDGAEIQADRWCEALEGEKICAAHPNCYYNSQFDRCDPCAQSLPDGSDVDCKALDLSKCLPPCTWQNDNCTAIKETSMAEDWDTFCQTHETEQNCYTGENCYWDKKKQECKKAGLTLSKSHTSDQKSDNHLDDEIYRHRLVYLLIAIGVFCILGIYFGRKCHKSTDVNEALILTWKEENGNMDASVGDHEIAEEIRHVL